MERDEAVHIARLLVASAGRLGYLVGRGSCWPDQRHLKRCKQAVGMVMGTTYDLLSPIWRAHEELDWARANDPLSLLNVSLPPEPLAPCDLMPHVQELRSNLPRVVAAMERTLESPARIATLHEYAQELCQSLDELERPFCRAPLRSR